MTRTLLTILGLAAWMAVDAPTFAAEDGVLLPAPRGKAQREGRLHRRENPAQAFSLASQSLEDPDPVTRIKGLRWFSSPLGATYKEDPLVVRRLVKAAKDADARVRGAALGALGAFAVTETTPMAIAALKDPEPMVRLQGAQILRETGDVSAIPALRSAVDDADASVRQASMAAWGALATEADLPAFRKILAHPDLQVRLQLVHALGRLGPKALPLLTDALTQPAPLPRQAVTIVNDSPTLDDIALPFYRKALAHPDPEVRQSALDGLADSHDPRGRALLTEALRDVDVTVRIAAIRGLGASDNHEAMIGLTLCLTDPDPAIRAAAVHALGASNAIAISPEFQRMTEDADPSVRSAAVHALMQSADPLAGPTLLKVMAKMDAAARQRMAVQFSEWHADGLPMLCALTRDADPLVRQRALESLSRVCLALDPSPPTGMWKPGTPLAEPGLRRQLVEALGPLLTTEPEAANRRLVITALGFAGPEALTLLTRELEQGDLAARITAIVALGRLKDRRALPWLVKALDDPEYNVQLQALAAMGAHGDDAIPAFQKALLHKNPQVAAQAQHWMGTLNVSASLLALLSMLEHADPAIRASAAHAIGQSRDLKGLPALREALNDPDPRVREGAQKGIDAMEGLESDEFRRVKP